MSTYRFGRIRLPSFSLRILFAFTAVISIILAGFAHKLHQAKQQTAAVERIRELGGVVPYVNTKKGKSVNTIENKLLVKLLGLDLFVTYCRVDLTDRSLSEQDVRAMIPYLRKLIPVEGMNQAGKTYIALDVFRNPRISERLIDDMRTALPNCEFSTCSSVPNGVEHVVNIGMTEPEVVDAVGALWLEYMHDWTWDSVDEKQQSIRRLGSNHMRYAAPNGLESWTYFADDVGIAVFGLDFDVNGRVAAIWFGRGTPPLDRQLTLIAE